MAATFATFKDYSTGQTKKVKVGISWSLLLFTLFFGLPLFYRRFYKMAVATLIASLIIVFSVFGIAGITYATIDSSISDDYSIAFILFVTLLVISYIVISYISVAVAVIGNKWTAKKYYNSGWKIIDGDSPQGKMTKIEMAWALPNDAFVEDSHGSRPFNSYPR